MGLDIVAYSNIKYIREYDTDKDEEYIESHGNLFYTSFPSHFEKQSKGIINKSIYSFENQYCWRAGSYSYYNLFRNTIAELAGYPSQIKDEDNNYCQSIWDGSIIEGPFYELINFSDCEGIINTECCVKLLKDFKWLEETVLKYEGKNSDLFKEIYLDFIQGLQLASNNGCLVYR